MNDAAILFSNVAIRKLCEPTTRAIAECGGFIRLLPPGRVTWTITSGDAARMARYGLTPDTAEFTLVMVNIPTETDEDEVDEANISELLTIRNAVICWDTMVDHFGLTEQPDLQHELRAFVRWVTDEGGNVDISLEDCFHGQSGQSRVADAGRVRLRHLYGEDNAREEEMLDRLRATASERQAESTNPAIFTINWYAEDTWTTPAGDNSGGVWTYQIADMHDQHLWQTLIYVVRNVKELYRAQADNTRRIASLGLAAKRWLSLQPAFQSLLREAIRRKMTFPSDVFSYFRQYALDSTNAPIEDRPWKDPDMGYQAEELERFLYQDIESKVGKTLRDIKLNDDSSS